MKDIWKIIIKIIIGVLIVIALLYVGLALTR